MDLFLSNVLMTTKQVVILYIIAIVGFIADRVGLYTEETAKKTNDLLFTVITPCVIINSFISTEFTVEKGKLFAMGIGVSVVVHVLGMVLATPFFNKNKNGAIYKFATVYGNVGYMGIPLTQAILGAEGVFYASTAVVVMNVLSFTQGMYIMTKKNKFDLPGDVGTVEVDKKQKRKTLLKNIFNPRVIGVIVGMPLFFLNVHVPELIGKPIELINTLMTPLAMIIIGTYISRADLKHMFNNPNRYLVAFLRLIVVPLATFGIAKLIGIKGAMLTSAIISAAAPSANSTVMFSVKYGKDTSEASQTITLITVLSIITMPIIIALTQL